MRPMRGGYRTLGLALAAASLAAAAPARAEEPARAVVAAGRQVSIRYTLRLEDGTTVESNVGEAEPFAYRHGAGDLLPGLERALEGMGVGESKRGTLGAAEAFGEIDAGLFVEVAAERIPEQDRKAGAWLDYRDESGERQRVRVHEVRGDRIVVDMNHPYAGSPVAYEVEVVKIE
jgi:FKBP-type peptidyl-prolyl cis-trans isomerase 2